MQRMVVSALLVCSMWWVPSLALAQAGDDEARRHFRLAEAHYANGSFEDAAREFEEAYRLSQRPQLLYNLYLAYRDAADLSRAAHALRRYLELVPDAEGASMLRGRLAALDRELAERASASTDSTTTDTATTDAAPDDTATTQADVEHADTTTTTTTTSDDAPSTASSSGGAGPVPWIVGGAGVVLVVAGAITGGMALGSQGTLDSTCPDRMCPVGFDHESEASTGRTLAITTDVLLITGGVALVTGIVLLAVMGGDGEEAPPATAGIGCDGTGCAIAVRARF